MKEMARSREELDRSPGCITRDSSIGLMRLLLVLMVFAMGVVIGLTSSSHIDSRYFTFQSQQIYNNYAAAPSTAAVENNCADVPKKCDKEDCLSMDSFLRPKNLTHRMTDEELFWRASLVPKKPEYPYTRVPKVAFMFLTRGPLPFLPLWERFFKGHEMLFSIYVHALPGYELNVSSSSPFYRRQIPSRKVQWGTVSLAGAEKRLLANALLDFSNERFVLVSESCIPIYNFPTLYKYLTESTHSFVESYDDPSRYGRGRYSRRMYPKIKLADWRKGSQWFEMTRKLAVNIVSDTKYYNIFKRYCTPACYPDEHYIPTFLHMFYGSHNANRTLTYVDWSRGGPHPAMYTREDVNASFIQSLRNNGTLCLYNSKKTHPCYMFARKFAPSALEPLLNLSSSVMRF